jgi:shikimate kinase
VLILITGPIASGKSTVARVLGDRLRAAGRSLAIIDADDVVLTIGGFRNLPWEHLELSLEVFGRLIDAWLSVGFDVIAHGPLYEQKALEVLGSIDLTRAHTCRIILRTTYEVALDRVSGDSERDQSKDPEFLRRAYHRDLALLAELPPGDLIFDTTSTSVTQVVDEIVGAVLGGTSRSAPR